MFKQILVPLDGSARAEQALPVVARLARASGGSVVLLRVASPPMDYGGGLAQAPLLTEQIIETELDVADSYLKTVATLDILAGITTTTDTMFGLPAQDILAVAESRRADLIVICSRGRTGLRRWALGSVAQSLTHQSPVPMLVLREGERGSALLHADATHPFCALVTLDGSQFAETALVPAANLVAALAAPATGVLRLTQVVTDLGEEAQERAKVYLVAMEERLQQTLRGLDLSIAWSLLRDVDAAGAIIDIAEHGEGGGSAERHDRCNLIAMSTHGRGGLERLVIGSVTERVLNATKLPMLIVHPVMQKTT